MSGWGRSFTYLYSLIRLLSSIRLMFYLPYRQVEGSASSLSKYVEGLAAQNYATLNRRVNSLDFNISEALTSSDEPVYVALDSTGIKVHPSGDWMRRRFKARKEYLKIHIAVNAKTMTDSDI